MRTYDASSKSVQADLLSMTCNSLVSLTLRCLFSSGASLVYEVQEVGNRHVQADVNPGSKRYGVACSSTLLYVKPLLSQSFALYLGNHNSGLHITCLCEACQPCFQGIICSHGLCR